jgi:uncharacterized repeat protein (TIGR01451 family)
MSRSTIRPGDYEALLRARFRAAQINAQRPKRKASRRDRIWVRLPMALVVIGALGIFAATMATAVHDAGLVELDGNVADDGLAVATDDWSTLFNASGEYIGPAGNQATFVADYPTPDYTYHAGSDKDQDDVTTWQCGDVNNPTPKDEILNAYAVLSVGTGGSHIGDTILNFGFERPVNNGTSFMGVWFFQSAVGCDSAPSGDTIPFNGGHSDGDILTLVNFTNGGAQFNIQVFEWVGTGGAYADGTMDLITSSGECGPSEGDQRVCGKVNIAAITTNWPNTEAGDNDLAAHQFFEGGLNINDLLAPAGQELPCFSTFMAETRTSDVFTAQLKDFAGGTLNSCGSIEASKYLDVNGNGQNDTEPALDGWTLNLFEDENGNGTIDPEDDQLDSQVTGAGGSVTYADLQAGDYIVCEELLSDTPPWVNSDPGDGTLCKPITVTVGETATVEFGNGQPDISVSKVADAEDVCSGATVGYVITVQNIGNVTLTNVDVEDDVLGTIASDLTLDPGDFAVYNPTHQITSTTTNTVTATGDWWTVTPAATATASATVTPHDCTISLTKIPRQTDVCDGTDVTYDYALTNNSDEFTWTGDLTDDVLGDVALDTSVGPGDTANFTATGTINGVVNNTATADGAFDDPASTTASTTADATVTGHDCSISLTKTPSVTEVCNGDSVDYTYVVTNNSDAYTWAGTLTDDVLGAIDGTITLAPGASQTLTASWVINGTVTNIATADGAFDDPASTTASTTATATVVGTPCGQGCTPGFWQGGLGITLWDEPIPDPDWAAHGGVGTNPFVTTDQFTSFFLASGNTYVDTHTMLEIVGSGGTSSWPRKAARDLIAAYLNSSFGMGYPYDTQTILDDWADAVAAGTSGFQAFHLKYAAANELGCTVS